MTKNALLAWLLLCVPAWADIDDDLVLHIAGDSSLTDTGSGSHTVAISSGTADYDTSGNPVGAAAIDVAANSRYVVVTDAADLSFGASNAAGTVAYWSKTSVTGTNQGTFSQLDAGADSDVDFYIDTTNKPRFVFRGSSTANLSVTGSPEICDGVWHHVAVTWEHTTGTTFQFYVYVDGVRVYSATAAWVPTADTRNLAIGARPDGTLVHGGQMDDVRAYNGRALTADEIVDLVALGPLTRLEVGQRSQWLLAETSGTTCADSTGYDPATFSTDASNLTVAGPSANYTAACEFDGTSESVTGILGTSSSLAGVTSATVSGHVRCDDPTNATRSQVIYEAGGTTQGIAVVVYDGEIYGCNSVGGSLATVSASIDSGWHSFAFAIDGTAMTLYLDGASVDTATGGTMVGGSDAGAIAGLASAANAPFFPPGYFDGAICDLRLHRRALSADDAAAIYALGASSAKPWLYTPINQILSRSQHRARTFTSQFEGSEPCYALAP